MSFVAAAATSAAAVAASAAASALWQEIEIKSIQSNSKMAKPKRKLEAPQAQVTARAKVREVKRGEGVSARGCCVQQPDRHFQLRFVLCSKYKFIDLH